MIGKDTIKAVLREHLITSEDFFGQCRQPHLIAARKEVALRLTALGFPSTKIGRLMKRDHSTVLNYISRSLQQSKRIRYSNSAALRHLNPEAQAVVIETARLEQTTPAIIVAQWINERASYEIRARDAA